MTWLMMLLALIGTVLNIRHNPNGFLLWGITNIYWAYHNVTINEYALATQFGVYYGFSAWGYYSWTKRQNQAKRSFANSQ